MSMWVCETCQSENRSSTLNCQSCLKKARPKPSTYGKDFALAGYAEGRTGSSLMKQVLIVLLSFTSALVVILLLMKFLTALEIEAQIVYQIGGPQPVARETFYLFDKDPLNLPLPEDSSTKLVAYHVLLSTIRDVRDKRYPDSADGEKIISDLAFTSPLWKQYVLAEATSDFQGRVSFERLTPGSYWILGTAQTRKSVAVWNLKIKANPAVTTKLLLSQHNAMSVD